MSDDKTKYDQARKIAIGKLSFIKHGIIYLLVIITLAIINNVTVSFYQWWLWPALGWGIGVVSHFLSAFLFQSGKMVDKLTKKEMDKLNE